MRTPHMSRRDCQASLRSVFSPSKDDDWMRLIETLVLLIAWLLMSFAHLWSLLRSSPCYNDSHTVFSWVQRTCQFRVVALSTHRFHRVGASIQPRLRLTPRCINVHCLIVTLSYCCKSSGLLDDGTLSRISKIHDFMYCAGLTGLMFHRLRLQRSYEIYRSSLRSGWKQYLVQQPRDRVSFIIICFLWSLDQRAFGWAMFQPWVS